MAKRTTSAGWRRGWRAGGLVCACASLLALSVRAENTGTPVSLQYAVTPANLGYISVTRSLQSSPFAKEPAASGRLIRGTVKFGQWGDTMGFLWQRDAGKLFLDLNGNRDLTDDPTGVFSTAGNLNSSYQSFTNIDLMMAAGAVAYPLRAELNLWEYAGRLSANGSLHSFWQAKVTLSGQDWQVGIIPNLIKPTDTCEGDSMVLRAWDRRSEPLDSDSFDTFPFSQRIFVAGHAYELQWRGGTNDGKFQPTLQFTERKVALGELRLNGQFVRRLLLPGEKYMVVCDRPGPSIRVPIGSYSPPDVLVDANGTRAYSESPRWQAEKKVVVSEQMAGTLEVGGPLTNSVTATSHGRDLRLDYQLMGAGGQKYQLMKEDVAKPPGFTIYKGAKQLAAGDFEFG